MTDSKMLFKLIEDNPLEILRITKEGVWANPDIPVDEAAKKVLEAIDHNIKVLVQKAVEEERHRLLGPYLEYDCDRCDYTFTQRQWVGLTDEEIKSLPSWWPSYEDAPALVQLVKDVEAKLREKNEIRNP
jgi:hypothetical protein